MTYILFSVYSMLMKTQKRDTCYTRLASRLWDADALPTNISYIRGIMDWLMSINSSRSDCVVPVSSYAMVVRDGHIVATSMGKNHCLKELQHPRRGGRN